jgi:hypothetical protein
MAFLEGWYLIAFVILVVFVVIRVINAKQNAATALALFLFLATALSMGYFFTSNDVSVESFGDFFDAGKVYFIWMGSVLKNVIAITSNVIHMDWSANSTAA